MYARQLGHVSLPSLLPSIYYINFLFLSLSLYHHTHSQITLTPPLPFSIQSLSIHLFSHSSFLTSSKELPKTPFPLFPLLSPPKKPPLRLVSHKDFSKSKTHLLPLCFPLLFFSFGCFATLRFQLWYFSTLFEFDWIWVFQRSIKWWT